MGRENWFEWAMQNERCAHGETCVFAQRMHLITGYASMDFGFLFLTISGWLPFASFFLLLIHSNHKHYDVDDDDDDSSSAENN